VVAIVRPLEEDTFTLKLAAPLLALLTGCDDDYDGNAQWMEGSDLYTFLFGRVGRGVVCLLLITYLLTFKQRQSASYLSSSPFSFPPTTAFSPVEYPNAMTAQEDLSKDPSPSPPARSDEKTKPDRHARHVDEAAAAAVDPVDGFPDPDLGKSEEERAVIVSVLRLNEVEGGGGSAGG